MREINIKYLKDDKFYFRFDVEDFEWENFQGNWKPGHVKERINKSLSRDANGRFILTIHEHHNKFDTWAFSEKYYELDDSEVLDCVNKAFEQNQITEKKKNDILAEFNAPFRKPIKSFDNVTVFSDDTYKLLKSGTSYYLCKGNESYKLTCHPYEPCTYIEGRCIHNAFNITDVFESFLYKETITSITGREYGPREFCDLVYAMVENNLQEENIDYVEKILWGKKTNIKIKDAPPQLEGELSSNSETEGADCEAIGGLIIQNNEINNCPNNNIENEEYSDQDDDEIDEQALETDFGYPLKGSLRERIIQMMEIAGDEENKRWKISSIKESYKKAKVNLYPTAEKFISRYAYLFSAMSPTFKYEIECTRFYFDCYDSIDEDTDQVELLRKATFDTTLPNTGYNFSKIYLKIKEKALCNITAVGRFGYFPASTLYIGENGKLYATKDNINDIRVYDNVVDLLEYELRDHIPMGITD